MLSILVVDDQPHILRVLKMGLQKQGYAVTTARNGVEALNILGNQKFDAMATDVDMPRMDGLTLCEKIADEMDIDHMKIFVVTAKTEQQVREWAASHASVVFLEKPLSLRTLYAKLEALERDKTQESLDDRRVAGQ